MKCYRYHHSMLGQLFFEIRRNQGPNVLVPAQDTHVDQTEKCLLLPANPGALCSHDAHKSTECSTSVIQFQSVCSTNFDICGMESHSKSPPHIRRQGRPRSQPGGQGQHSKQACQPQQIPVRFPLHIIMFPKHIAMP